MRPPLSLKISHPIESIKDNLEGKFEMEAVIQAMKIALLTWKKLS